MRNWNVSFHRLKITGFLAGMISIQGVITHADVTAQGIFAKVADRIVTITTISGGGSSIAQGSGVVLGPSLSPIDPAKPGFASFSKGIDILTNYHVVKRAKVIVIHTRAGNTFNAGLLYFDELQDLALLRIPLELKIGDIPLAASVTIGEDSYAVGTPEGLGWSISNGIISGQRITDDKSEAVQTTAPISPGSSGGGLFNAKGELVGITSFTLREGQNLNFARRISPAFAGYLAKFRKRLMAYPWEDVSFGGELSAVLDQDWELGHFEASDGNDTDPARWRHANPTFAKFVAEGAEYEKFKNTYSQAYEKLAPDDPRYQNYKGLRNKFEIKLYTTIPEPRFFDAYFENIKDPRSKMAALEDARQRWPEDRQIALTEFAAMCLLPDNYQTAIKLLVLRNRQMVSLSKIREQVVHGEDPSSETAFNQLRNLGVFPYRQEVESEIVRVEAMLKMRGINNVDLSGLRQSIISKNDLP
jgi:S1-C subfamily serine protease